MNKTNQWFEGDPTLIPYDQIVWVVVDIYNAGPCPVVNPNVTLLIPVPLLAHFTWDVDTARLHNFTSNSNIPLLPDTINQGVNTTMIWNLDFTMQPDDWYAIEMQIVYGDLVEAPFQATITGNTDCPDPNDSQTVSDTDDVVIGPLMIFIPSNYYESE